MGIEIHCPSCEKETLLRREPVYEGFKKTGEHLFCSACGHRFDNENEVVFVAAAGRPAIFSANDRVKVPKIFSAEDDLRNCRHCRHYVVNPFTQRCTKYEREVEATDCCDSFEKAPEQKQSSDKEKKDNPLAKLLG